MGHPRKSRLARVPTSFMAGSFEFEPTEDDWRRIEAAYPFLSPADRDEISRMATEYLMRAPFESRAPKAVDAMAWLVEVEKAATVFCNAGHKRASTEEKELAATYARVLWSVTLDIAYYREGSSGTRSREL